MTTYGNRRRDQRIESEVLVWWNQAWEDLPLILQDISRGGFKLVFPSLPDQRQELQIVFEWPGRHEPVEVCCDIVHVHQMDSGQCLCGMKIRSVAPSSKKAFDSLIDSLLTTFPDQETLP
jgi:hypothetical protein